MGTGAGAARYWPARQGGAFRSAVAGILASEPDLLSVEILRRVKLRGYVGGKTALYELIAPIRPTTGATARPV